VQDCFEDLLFSDLHGVSKLDKEQLIHLYLQLLNLIISKAAFGQLRTVEQLGYIVHTYLDRFSNIESLNFFVQSGTYSSEYVRTRIDSFVHTFLSTLLQMSTAEWELYLQTLHTNKAEPLLTLSDLNDLLWTEIHTQQYKFDRRQNQVTLIEKFLLPSSSSTFASFLTFYQHLFRIPRSLPPAPGPQSAGPNENKGFLQLGSSHKDGGPTTTCWSGFLEVGLEPVNVKKEEENNGKGFLSVEEKLKACALEHVWSSQAGSHGKEWIDIDTVCQYRHHALTFTIQANPLSTALFPREILPVPLSSLQTLNDLFPLFPIRSLQPIPSCSEQK
jgi:hypothetical protein